ncbi:MAG: hypothetical protein KF773_27300 [Deltaproteobacteria bacterium]|nr:hypothetical protein [Deltaproteobacteria bacterium]
MKRSRHTFLKRSTATMLAAIAILRIGPATGSPGEIYQVPAPAIGSDPPKSAELKSNDASVSSQTGALQYSYPIKLPPNRGNEVQLALSYSSQGAIYGGVAAGWSLAIPSIQEDTSHGRLRTHSPEVEVQQGTEVAGNDDPFTSSLAGGKPLVMVAEPGVSLGLRNSDGVYRTYRAQSDSTFARYERMGATADFKWRVRTTDGSILYFGDYKGGFQHLTQGCVVSEGNAPLTRVEDAFGNQVAYRYQAGADGECRISKITYGQNAFAGVGTFATVNFTYANPIATCADVPIGSQTSYRTGTKVVTGASKLTSIVALAHPPNSEGSPDHTRQITLAYKAGEEVCNAQHAPLRLLESIQESAWGTDSPRVDLPPVKFTYGPTTLTLAPPSITHRTPWAAGNAYEDNLAWGIRKTGSGWPTVEAMMLDMDGDGLLDRVINASGIADGAPTYECRVKWYRNLGPKNGDPAVLSFDTAARTFVLPRLKWHGSGGPALGLSSFAGAASPDPFTPSFERCALNGQATAYRNTNTIRGVCHDGTACVPGEMTCAGGTACPLTNDSVYSQTYLAYRWMDMNGDGLVDLVAAVHGDTDDYDIDHAYPGAPGFCPGGALHCAEPQLFGAWPACPTSTDSCRDLGSTCMGAARTCVSGSPCTINWSALNSCLAAAAQQPCNNQINAKKSPPQIPGGGGGGGGGGGPPPVQEPYMRCQGLYPWFIYKNTGNGTFATTPEIKYQPLPLESDSGDSNTTGPSLTSQNHGILDFDGDGILDAVARPRGVENQTQWWWWFVWPGDGNGGFGPRRYVFPSRNYPDGRISGVDTGTSDLVGSSEGLLDINGDGIPEHWLAQSPGNANIAINDGTQFAMFGTDFGPRGGYHTPGGLGEPVNVKPGNDTRITVIEGNLSTHTVYIGDTRASLRVVDVDNDGRADVVTLPSSGSPYVFFNAGGQFIAGTAPSYPGDTLGLERRVHADRTNLLTLPPSQVYTWELRADLTDLDGDGVQEGVFFPEQPIPDEPTQYTTYGQVGRANPFFTAPLRLMHTIESGRGLTTSITYDSMHGAGNNATVEQHPEETWFDGRPKATPHTQRVVKSIVTTDAFSASGPSTTTMHYKNPRHGLDEGRYAFRGFEEVTTTAPSGARTVQVYDYSVDATGRLIETVQRPAETPSNGVHSIERTTWTAHGLFPNSSGAPQVWSYHASSTETLTCGHIQTYAPTSPTGPGPNECLATTAPGYTRRTVRMDPLPATGVAQVLVEGRSAVYAGATDGDGDRETLTTYDVAFNATTYLLHPADTIRNHRVGGAMTLYAKSRKTWDASHRVPVTDEVWFDAVDANRAIASTTYDMTTGNVLSHKKPKQNAAGTAATTNTYDSRKLFATTVVNEVGHQFDYIYEYGTGVKLQTEGPNARGCVSNCPEGATYPLKEQHKIRIDGLGRSIEKWDTVSDDGSIYTLYLRETTSYVDTASGATPTSLTHQTRHDTTANSVWKQEKTEYDGHGRTTKQTVFAQGSAPADQITTFTYRADGTLQTVSLPDPTANNASVVTYTYGFDSLGRATSIRRPDAVNITDQSGVDIGYDGMTTVTAEWVGVAGGHSALTMTVKDRLGRLVEVRERIADGTYAITHYGYGPDDVVNSVIDPEGVTTTMTHDFAGHRTAITRPGGRTWKFTYDKNGNVASEQVPGSTSPVTDPAFTTTYAYDNLDRVTSKVIGQRNLSPGDQALFASRTETLTWDYGGNRKGYLRYWQSFAPSTSTPAIILEAANNNQGQRTLTEHRMSIAGYPQLLRQHINYYWLFGGVRQTRFVDQVGGSNQTIALTWYDARLLPTHITLSRSGEQQLNIATQTRNVAGLVTKRRTNTTGAMTFVESNWTYDKLGRVVDQTVQKGPGPTQVARQSLTYLGNDNPATLDHYLGTTQRHFTYEYDMRHQITGASETTTPGYFSASYDYGLAGRFSRAAESQTAPPPGSEVVPRDVEYVYGGTDPEQVTALHVTGSSTPFATYTFDDAGNQTSRCYGTVTTPTCAGELLEFVYDGKDQLRRATRKVNGVITGSEEYWYQSEGQRIAIVRRDSAGLKTEMVWFIGDTEAHYDSSGSVTHVYSHPSLGTPVARVDRTTNTATVLEYQFQGLSSSTLATVDHAGTVTASFIYSPYGATLEADEGAPGALVAHVRRHNDKFTDQINGLAYYGVRYYDREGIFWTQSDPKYRHTPESAGTQPRRASLYMFSLSNALRYMDPDGRNALAIAGGVVLGEEIVAGVAVVMSAAAGILGPCRLCDLQEKALAAMAAAGATGTAAAAAYTADVTYVGTHPYVGPNGDRSVTPRAVVGAGGAVAAIAAPILMGDRDRITPPSWVINEGHRPRPGESAQQFAKRILNEKYGRGRWDKGGGNEFSSIVKWVHRGLGAGIGASLASSNDDNEESKKRTRHKPADLNNDGKVEDYEEERWMRSQQ